MSLFDKLSAKLSNNDDLDEWDEQNKVDGVNAE